MIKPFIATAITLAVLCSSLTYGYDHKLSDKATGILNHAMPLLPNKTLDGKTIDDNYYKGHVTLVTCMYIGCMPCMNEINILNKINDEYAATGKVQVLCVARQMKEQMIQFNTVGKSHFSKVRKALHVDSIRYAIQPACKDDVSKMIITGADTAQEVQLKSECATIEDVFGVNAYPTLFYVDKKGTVRKIKIGGPPTNNDAGFYDELKKEIDTLLTE